MKNNASFFEQSNWEFDLNSFNILYHDIQNLSNFYWQWLDKSWLSKSLDVGIVLAFPILFLIGILLRKQLEQKIVLPALSKKYQSLNLALNLLSQLIINVSPYFFIIIFYFVTKSLFPKHTLAFFFLYLSIILSIFNLCSNVFSLLIAYSHIPENKQQKFIRQIIDVCLVTAILQIFNFSFKLMRYQGEVYYLLSFLTQFILFLLLIRVGLNKELFLSLLPEGKSKITLKFQQILNACYYYVVFYFLILGALKFLGYNHLFYISMSRSLAILGLILILYLFNNIIHRVLNSYASKYQIQDKISQYNLFAEIRKLSLLVEGYFGAFGILSIFNFYDLFIHVLSYPIFYFSKTSISLLTLLQALLILYFFLIVTRIIIASLEQFFYPKMKWDRGLAYMVSTSIRYVLLVVGFLMVLSATGLDLSMFAVFAGALGVGVGFGLQGIAKNFASGVILIFGRLVKQGDYVTVNNQTGCVQEVGWRKVHVKTLENVDLIIPTSNFIESTIVNWTLEDPKNRVHIPVGVSYSSDVHQVTKALLEASTMHPQILSEPKSEVWFVGFGDSSLNFELLVWIDHTLTNPRRLIGEMNYHIWDVLKAYQIEIPFPQRDLHIRSSIPLEFNPDQSTIRKLSIDDEQTT